MDRFQRLTFSIAHIHKTIQRIKNLYMSTLDMKGSHAICFWALNGQPDGLTAAQLGTLCDLDKAAVSRLLKELEQNGDITYAEPSSENSPAEKAADPVPAELTANDPAPRKRYRSRVILTARGREQAEKVQGWINDSVLAGGNRITDEELGEFYRILSRLTENLDELADRLEERRYS